jgi:hypothetical protein
LFVRAVSRKSLEWSFGQTMPKEWYAIARGRQIGIFTSWHEVRPLVEGYSGAKFKGFHTKEEALSFLFEAVSVSSPSIVYSTPSPSSWISPPPLAPQPTLVTIYSPLNSPPSVCSQCSEYQQLKEENEKLKKKLKEIERLCQ